MDNNTDINENEEQFSDYQEDITLSDAVTGVFTDPSETFTRVKLSKKSNYWIIPLAVLILISALASFLVINDDELYSEIKTMQAEAMQKRFDESVEKGQMTKEDAQSQMDNVDNMFSRNSSIFWITALAAPIFTIVIAFFIRGIVFFGAAKLFKGDPLLSKILSVLGIAAVIDIIQTIVNTVLAIFTGKLMVNIGPVLFFEKEQIGDSMFQFLSHFDIFNIWWIILVGIGLAKVSELKTPNGIIIVAGLWMIWHIISTYFGTSIF